MMPRPECQPPADPVVMSPISLRALKNGNSNGFMNSRLNKPWSVPNAVTNAVTTHKGLKVRAEIDPAQYEKGIKVIDAEVAAIRIARDDFHGEWNYAISSNR